MGTVIDTELGIAIECSTSGEFSAVVSGQRVADKSLTKVRKAIRSAVPTVPAIVEDHWGLTVIEVAEVKPYADRVLAVQPAITIGRDTYRDNRNHYDPCEHDPALLDELKQLGDAIRDRRRAIDRQYNDGVEKIKQRLVPLTPERFQQLLAEKKGDE